MKVMMTVCLTLLAFSLNAAPPDWTIKSGHKNAMIVYVRVLDSSGHPMVEPGCRLGAFEHGNLVGSTPVSQGPEGPVYQLKVGSDQVWSALEYKFYDPKTDGIIPVESGPEFVSGTFVGTIARPISLRLKNPIICR